MARHVPQGVVTSRQAAFLAELKRLQVVCQHAEGAKISNSFKIPFTGCKETVTTPKVSSSLSLLGFLASWSSCGITLVMGAEV